MPGADPGPVRAGPRAWSLQRERSESRNKSSLNSTRTAPLGAGQGADSGPGAGCPHLTPGLSETLLLGQRGDVTHFLPRNDLERTPFLTAAGEAAPQTPHRLDHLELQPPAPCWPRHTMPPTVPARRAPQPRCPSAWSPPTPHAPRERDLQLEDHATLRGSDSRHQVP